MMQTGFRNLRRWPFATVLSARKYGYDNIFAPHGAARGAKLCMAILRGDNTEARRIIDSGADLGYQDEPDGWTPLIYSIYYRNPAACRWLLAHGADPNQCDYSGRTPLMVAAVVGDRERLTELLEHGGAADRKDCHGQTAADFARKFHNRECAELLRNAAIGSGEDHEER